MTVGTVFVTDAAGGGLAQEIRAGRHVIIADEPEGVGDDLGPTPYDLLLASLGACTAMTLRLYAERKGWSLEHVSVQLTHERIHADDSRGKAYADEGRLRTPRRHPLGKARCEQ